jgi:hypothetical protein
MKKAVKIEYGIEIVKPWSKAMYDHNDMVADAVRVKVFEMWTDVCDTDGDEDWQYAATPEMIKIQQAVLCHGFGPGFDVAEVARRVEAEIESAPYYRLKEIAEELDITLKKGFVGFS